MVSGCGGGCSNTVQGPYGVCLWNSTKKGWDTFLRFVNFYVEAGGFLLKITSQNLMALLVIGMLRWLSCYLSQGIVITGMSLGVGVSCLLCWKTSSRQVFDFSPIIGFCIPLPNFLFHGRLYGSQKSNKGLFLPFDCSTGEDFNHR